MPWNLGVFTRTNGQFTGATVWQQDEAAGENIEADRHDTHDQDMADGIDQCLNRTGQNEMSANLKMGGNLLTGLGSGTAADHSINKGQADAAYFRRDGGSAATANLNMGGNNVTDLADPVADADGVPLSFVSALTGVNGNVSSTGTILFGSGFTVNKTGTGIYDLTFTKAAAATNQQTCIATVSTNTSANAYAELISTTVVRITVTNYSGGSGYSNIDADFNFERKA